MDGVQDGAPESLHYSHPTWPGLPWEVLKSAAGKVKGSPQVSCKESYSPAATPSSWQVELLLPNPLLCGGGGQDSTAPPEPAVKVQAATASPEPAAGGIGLTHLDHLQAWPPPSLAADLEVATYARLQGSQFNKH